MSESHTADAVTGETGAASGEPLPLGVNPDAPPHARAAATAYHKELNELLEYLAAHPDERWVAYYWGQRIGIGSDHLRLHRECSEKYPNGGFFIYGIAKYLTDTVV